MRVASQLIDLSNGLHLWSEIYDRTLGGVFDIQEDIAQAIVEALKVRLAPGERAKLRPHAPASAEAHEHYLKGRYFWHKNTPADAQKSVHHMERAIALDPTYAAAYAGLADAYLLWLSQQTEAPEFFVPKARSAAETALALEDSAEAHSAMAMVLAVGDWNWSASEREFRRAFHLKPSFAFARMLYAVTCLCPLRRHREAVTQLRQALSLDPLSVFTRIMLGQTLIMGGDGESAVEELQLALDLEPGSVFGHITLGLAYLAQSRHREAVDVLSRLGESGREFPNCLGHLGFALAVSGDRTEAELVLRALLDRFSGPWVPCVDVAAIYNGLGDTTAAVEWLTRAHSDRSFDALFVIDDPRFVNLRSDVKFLELFARS
jgi:tetratricopeptide (TPR) repeat protein